MYQRSDDQSPKQKTGRENAQDHYPVERRPAPHIEVFLFSCCHRKPSQSNTVQCSSWNLKRKTESLLHSNVEGTSICASDAVIAAIEVDTSCRRFA